MRGRFFTRSIWLDEALPGGPDLFPLATASRQLTVFCEEQPDTPVVYTSDEHGFRNERFYSSAVRAAAVGDTFTQGACVDGGKGFVAIIANRLGPILDLGQTWSRRSPSLAGRVEPDWPACLGVVLGILAAQKVLSPRAVRLRQRERHRVGRAAAVAQPHGDGTLDGAVDGQRQAQHAQAPE
jgi:hypothetical protein